MTSRPGRPRAALVSLAVALVLCALAPVRGASGAEDEPVMPSNAQLLLGASRAAARSLVAQAPLTPGTRVGLRREPGEGMNSDALDALIMALNERRIECIVLEPLPVEAAGATGAAPATPADTAGAKPAGSTDLGEFVRLQADRAAQAAKADSIARVRGGLPPAPQAAPAPVPAR
jgi:hypothetical protein